MWASAHSLAARMASMRSISLQSRSALTFAGESSAIDFRASAIICPRFRDIVSPPLRPPADRQLLTSTERIMPPRVLRGPAIPPLWHYFSRLLLGERQTSPSRTPKDANRGPHGLSPAYQHVLGVAGRGHDRHLGPEG